MALNLRDKLNMMAGPPAAREEERERGVMERVDVRALPGELMIGAPVMRRMKFPFDFDPRDAVFLDTETTGLAGAGTVAFLVGVGTLGAGGEFTVRQFTLLSYADEPELLERVADAIGPRRTMVSFNGKSFDAPLLESRSTMCRLPSVVAGMRHLDLLHPARRAWKLRLKKCDLGSLEARILGTPRESDLPGSEVPERFFSYLRTGDISLLDEVIEHNLKDIVSLTTLLTALGSVYAAPAEQGSILDLYSMGNAMLGVSEVDRAVECYSRAAMQKRPVTDIEGLVAAPYSQLSAFKLSLIHRRRGEWDEAERIWQDLAGRGQLGSAPLIELAKLYEHRRRDPASALKYTRLAIGRESDEINMDGHRRREARLLAKINGRAEVRK